MLVIVRLANQLARVAWAAQAKERFTGLQPWRRKAIRQEAWGGRKESIGAQWMRDGIGKPVFILHRARLIVMDPICELPYGAAANDRPHDRPNRCQHPNYAGCKS